MVPHEGCRCGLQVRKAPSQHIANPTKVEAWQGEGPKRRALMDCTCRLGRRQPALGLRDLLVDVLVGVEAAEGVDAEGTAGRRRNRILFRAQVLVVLLDPLDLGLEGFAQRHALRT